MHVVMRRSGGFHNIRLAAEADTRSRELTYGAARTTRMLSSDEARQLEARVRAARFFDLPASITAAKQGVDRFEYTLIVRVEEEGEQHTVRTTDAAAPPTLQPLLEDLTRLAMGQTLAALDDATGGSARS